MPAGTGAQKRIRDLQRLIKKAGNDQERIAALQQKIEEVSNEKATRVDPDIKKKHEEKYHLVKFVERKKLTRMIQRVMKQVDTETNEATKQQLQTKLDNLKDDLCYVMYVHMKCAPCVIALVLTVTVVILQVLPGGHEVRRVVCEAVQAASESR